MLKKLMKHEFRATLRVMAPVYLLLLATSVGARFSISGLLETDSGLLNLLGGLLVVAFAVTMAAVCLLTAFLMVYRFYQNLLRDEGYVMMTLPVSVHQQVWSKLLVGVVWCVVTAIAVGAALVILVLDLDMLEGIRRFGGEVWALLRSEYGFDGVLVLVELAVLCVVAVCSTYLEFYCALAIGHSRPNHKLVWSIAAYFGMDILLTLVGAPLMELVNATGIFDRLDLLSFSASQSVHMGLWIATLVCALGAAVYYALTTWFLENRLNLE